MARILMVVSSADALIMKDGTSHPTGVWAEELVVAHRALRGAGHSVQLASPGGVKPTIDAASLDPDNVGGQEKADEFRGYLEDIDGELSSPLVLAHVTASEFDGVVLPGGHGPMADLAANKDLGRILVETNDAGKVIAPFCHGPAGLLSAVNDDGSFAFAGRRLTVFTNEEEMTGGTGENTPWLVEDVLKERGAVLEGGDPFTSFVVRDRNLITGQNPMSSEDVAKEVIKALAE